MNITATYCFKDIKDIKDVKSFKDVKSIKALKKEKPKLIDINKKVDKRGRIFKTFQCEKKVEVKEIENMLTLMLYKDMFCSEYCELLENTEDVLISELIILEQKE
jgi:hypothetical protein